PGVLRGALRERRTAPFPFLFAVRTARAVAGRTGVGDAQFISGRSGFPSGGDPKAAWPRTGSLVDHSDGCERPARLTRPSARPWVRGVRRDAVVTPARRT